ncbi:hypothetical protein GGI43DRAFT_418904 [Trichoderma evansii]
MVTLRDSLFWIAANIGMSLASVPQAAVYRGPAACPDCAEAVAQLLSTSPLGFNVTFVGPTEAVGINSQVLALMDVYAQPGGGDVEDAWKDMQQYAKPIQDFVSSGGRYMGFCVGAYLADNSPGFGLVPQGDGVGEEIAQPGAQINTTDDTIINVDWTFSTGDAAGKTQQKRWLYFQDGAVMNIAQSPTSKILARYSSNDNIAASLTPYGKGWVGLVGPHPEATQDWYDDNGFTNPEGLKFDIGYDFIETTFKGFV